MAVLRSPVPHARIVSIDTSQAEKMPGVVGVLRAADIKGTNLLKLQVPDRPVLCTDKVHYIGDPILAVAAETRAQAEAALEAVKVDFDPLPVLESPEASLADGAVRVHPDRPNLCMDQPVIKGDAEEALRNSAAVVEARFSTPRELHGALGAGGHGGLLGGRGQRAKTPCWSSSGAASTSITIWPCSRRPSAGRT